MEIRKCIFGEGESQLEGESFLFFFFLEINVENARKMNYSDLVVSRAR